MLGKPANETEAFQMLKELNNNKHLVFTGICLRDKYNERVFSVRSEVYFKKISDEDLLKYIRENKPFDKAGSYGAQECLPENYDPCSMKEKHFLETYGYQKLFENTQSARKSVALIDHIEGSYFNVMGLPVAELADELKKFQ
jgi:septum formation protein